MLYKVDLAQSRSVDKTVRLQGATIENPKPLSGIVMFIALNKVV